MIGKGKLRISNVQHRALDEGILANFKWLTHTLLSPGAEKVQASFGDADK
jgi:hypothetical protein